MEGLRTELPELYRELQLLRLKYEHLADVCRKLTKSWPNRGRDGRLIKAEETTTAREKQKSEKDCGTQDMKQRETPDLKLLENILKKAQRIKLSDEEQIEATSEKQSLRRFTAESCKKAAKVYQPVVPKEKHTSTGVKSVNPSSRHKSSASKDHQVTKHSSTSREKALQPAASKSVISSKANKVKSRHLPPSEHNTVPAVKIVKHAARSSEVCRRPGIQESPRVRSVVSPSSHSAGQASSASRLASVVAPHADYQEEEEEDRKFHLFRDGSKLCMSSKYNTLRNTFSKMQEHISSQTPDPSTEAMREHFVKRLIPHDRQAPTRALQLQLAMQEYQLLTRELDSLSPREWAVSERSETKDVLRVKEKLEFIIERASALEKELGPIGPSKTTASLCSEPDTMTKQESAQRERGVDSGGPLGYTTLSELLQLVEVEHKQRMLKIEVQLLEFCIEVVLPKYKASREKLSTTSIQILSELAGLPKPIFVCDD